ncbi:MAG: hypothetical protein KBC78_04005 [Candidatus Pacebacteria bacterium]|nr:hypothetical protein [Candidatus Paceibacterota bacterium]
MNTGKVLDLFADVCDEVRSGELSVWKISGTAFTIITSFYFLLGAPVLLALITGDPVTSSGLIYEPLVNFYKYLKYM